MLSPLSSSLSKKPPRKSKTLSPMAVDAGQIFINRDLGNFVQANGSLYSSNPMGYGVFQGPLSGTTTATDALMQMYGSAMADSVLAKAPVRSDSGLSYAVPVSRKRPREAVVNVNDHQQLLSFAPGFQNLQQNDNHWSSFTFFGEDFSAHFQQQQSEIDRFIAQHTRNVRMEMEEKRKSYSRRIMAAVEDVIVKKLRAKEEEIEKIGKLNWALEERVKSLYVENQIWRELAQTNEATANALRSNLEQVLTQVQDDQQRHHRAAAAAELTDDAESCCGSNCMGGDVVGEIKSSHNRNGSGSAAVESTTAVHGGTGNGKYNTMCRNCWKEEASVLLMPCRHLCLCNACCPIVHNCPICNSARNVMVRVNLVPS